MVGDILPPPLPGIEREPDLSPPALDISSLDQSSILLIVEMIARSSEESLLGEQGAPEPVQALTEALQADMCRLVWRDMSKAKQVIHDMARSQMEFVRDLAALPLGVLLRHQCDVADRKRSASAVYLVGIFRDQELEQPGRLHGAHRVMVRILDEGWLDPDLQVMFERALRKS